ncbi:MAG: imidazole glycerol phosphate synthase subunit HisH [Actinomycetota bacterium]
MEPAVALVDAGIGNIRSVENAFAVLDCNVDVVAAPDELASATHVVLPGVGGFGEGMAALRKGHWVDALARAVIAEGRPFLGICLGMQLLATHGTEHGQNAGLDWIDGTVDRLSDMADVRIPHIGWNDVQPYAPSPLLSEFATFYFVHSYALPTSAPATVATTEHGQSFAAIVQRDNVFGVQFHPEKSHRAGLDLLRNFLAVGLTMLKSRVIPCLLLMNGRLVRSEQFVEHQVIGYPLHEVARFSEWAVDELIYLDISREGDYDIGRDDHKVGDLRSPLEILEHVSRTCFMPLTFGGLIRSVADMKVRFASGADKIAVNTAAFDTPDIVASGAHRFGSQAIVVAIDVLRSADGRTEVYVDRGCRATGIDPITWACEAERLGAGEILLQSIDRDGTGRGYDVELIAEVSGAVQIPVVALGGVGTYEHFHAAIAAGASAVAAANIFHFKELSDRGAKRALRRAGAEVRL